MSVSASLIVSLCSETWHSCVHTSVYFGHTHTHTRTHDSAIHLSVHHSPLPGAWRELLLPWSFVLGTIRCDTPIAIRHAGFYFGYTHSPQPDTHCEIMSPNAKIFLGLLILSLFLVICTGYRSSAKHYWQPLPKVCQQQFLYESGTQTASLWFGSVLISLAWDFWLWGANHASSMKLYCIFIAHGNLIFWLRIGVRVSLSQLKFFPHASSSRQREIIWTLLSSECFLEVKSMHYLGKRIIWAWAGRSWKTVTPATRHPSHPGSHWSQVGQCLTRPRPHPKFTIALLVDLCICHNASVLWWEKLTQFRWTSQTTRGIIFAEPHIDPTSQSPLVSTHCSFLAFSPELVCKSGALWCDVLLVSKPSFSTQSRRGPNKCRVHHDFCTSHTPVTHPWPLDVCFLAQASIWDINAEYALRSGAPNAHHTYHTLLLVIGCHSQPPDSSCCGSPWGWVRHLRLRTLCEPVSILERGCLTSSLFRQ